MLSRIETGRKTPTPEEVATMLAVYRIRGTERERLLRLARDDDHPGWWIMGDEVHSAPLKALVVFEADAVRITDVELSLVPGLLQIPEYTAAALRPRMTEDQIKARVAVRQRRQSILTGPNPPRLLTYLDEAILRRPIGSCQIMAGQLRHICKQAERPGIVVRVMPFQAGEHASLGGPFTLLDFERSDSLVCLEGNRSFSFVDDPAEVRCFKDILDTLKRSSLPPDRSIELINSVAAAYGK
jgi:hypothetical protein